MEARLFEIKHRLVATEKMLLKIPFEEVMLILFQASKELHWSLAKHNVAAGEYIFATPKTYRCSGEVIFVKVQMEQEHEEFGEICHISMMSRPRRSSTMFDFKKNLFNIQKLLEVLSEYHYLDNEIVTDH